MAQFKELLVFGTTRVLDTVYAKKFVGAFEGTSDRAVADKNGKDITTYIAGISGDGTSDTITITYGDGTTGTFTTKDTQVVVANNLSTNEATQALSAAQGVVIRNSIVWDTWGTTASPNVEPQQNSEPEEP
jgi:hypothetical protein